VRSGKPGGRPLGDQKENKWKLKFIFGLADYLLAKLIAEGNRIVL
jgi:hypothetical protein